MHIQTPIVDFIKTLSKSDYWDSQCRAVVFRQLSKITSGSITIQDGLGTKTFGVASGQNHVNVVVHDLGFYRRSLFIGSTEIGAAYARGEWDCDHLINLIRMFAVDRQALKGMDLFVSKGAEQIRRWSYKNRSNTLHGSRENISAHYDLGNEFFKLILDDEMMYSCAYFENENTTLNEASLLKLKRICEKLKLSSKDHLLEIGTGWGGLSIFAAKNYGCKVTSVTISQKQYEYAVKRIHQLELQNLITIQFQDYRSIQGKYDKIVSVEMIEAVGADHQDTYFSKINELLSDRGIFLLQAITINDQNYRQALKDIDFIKAYIFPGSYIPSVSSIMDSILRVTSLRLYHLEDLTSHYAKTLRCWQKRLNENSESVREIGYSESLIRLWNYYFSYCVVGFEEHATGDVQMIFAKPQARFERALPAKK